jgi:hypothetical protein
MVAPRLLGLGRDRAEAVLAEPDGRARRARRHAAHAQQLQHRLAARHAGCALLLRVSSVGLAILRFRP